MRYQIKVDTWLVVVLAGAIAFPIAIGSVGYARAGASPAVWLPM
jgi:hypothetical protein